MISRDLFVEMPPNALDRVVVRGVRGQQVDLDPVLVLPQVFDHFMTGMEPRVVADHVDLLVAAEATPEVVQVLDEQGTVATLLGGRLGDEYLPGPPVDRT